MMYTFGLFLAILIGVVLGLVGGGGSILTVPLVHYLFGTSMLLATSYSLFVVAVSSGIGVFKKRKSGTIDYRNGLVFVIPSMIVAFFIRKTIMPEFPSEFNLGGYDLTRDTVISILLIVVMLFVAIKSFTSKKAPSENKTSTVIIVLFGILTGVLSGFIGAGGGFIIVPILLRMGHDMKKAVGTSMYIICIQSTVALSGDFFNEEIMHGKESIDWTLLFSLTLLTIVGVFIGTYLQKYLTGKYLRKIFSIVLIVVALGMSLELIRGIT